MQKAETVEEVKTNTNTNTEVDGAGEGAVDTVGQLEQVTWGIQQNAEMQGRSIIELTAQRSDVGTPLFFYTALLFFVLAIVSFYKFFKKQDVQARQRALIQLAFGLVLCMLPMILHEIARALRMFPDELILPGYFLFIFGSVLFYLRGFFAMLFTALRNYLFKRNKAPKE